MPELGPKHVPLLVESFQREHGLRIDGIPGKQTMSKLEEVLNQRTKVAVPNTLTDLGLRVMQTAKLLWESDVVDLPHITAVAERKRCVDIIDRFIRTPIGLNWTHENLYDGSFKWCGAFAATCWGSVGLNADMRKFFWASCYRLDRWADYRDIENRQNIQPQPSRRKYLKLDETSVVQDIAEFGVQAGDVLLIGKANSYGHHICLIESFDSDSRIFHTIEGNGGGIGPRGDKRVGIVRGRRRLGLNKSQDATKLSHARRIIRPSIDDIVI